MAHYPYVNLAGSAGGCTTELTQIASSSTAFYPDFSSSMGVYYIGTIEGWDNASLDQTYVVSAALPLDNANCAIKSPVKIGPGDVIKICGIASGTTNSPFTAGTNFSVYLGFLICGEFGNNYPDAWNVNELGTWNFAFDKNHVCWTATCTMPSKFPAGELEFLIGFGAEEKNDCGVTWTLDVEKTCVGPCDTEYTNIAVNSLLFMQVEDVFSNGMYYGFSNKCGWRGSGDTSLQLISGGTIKNSDTFDGIKLPINLVQGDEIVIYGTASGLHGNPFSDGSNLSVMLKYFKCSEAGTIHDNTPIYDLNDSTFTFFGNHTCFYFRLRLPPEGLLACDTMFLLGFGTTETGIDCQVSYTMNVERACGTCDVEYTPVAKTSGSWQQKKIAGQPLYYIGNDYEGWNSCSLTVIQQINRQEISQSLSVNYTNSGIKLPYDLVQGDKIRICGSVVANNNVQGVVFTAVLTQFLCTGYDSNSDSWVVSPQLGITTTTFNANNVACWLLEYVVPAGGMPACDTNLLLGMKTEADSLNYRFTWTMDIVKMCPGPTEIGCCFTHAKTVFVDPNGNNLTALEGKQTKPWKSIASAIEYLRDNGRTGYTVEVFPGEYLDEQNWTFVAANTETTVKLNGGVKITTAAVFTSGAKGFLDIHGAKVKIVGDDRDNSIFSNSYTGSYIEMTPNTVHATFGLLTDTSELSITNVAINDTNIEAHSIVFGSSCSGGKIMLNNVAMVSLNSSNIYVYSCDKPPLISIKDSDLYTGKTVEHIGTENIYIQPVAGAYTISSFIFIENSRLIINGQYGGTEGAARSHIYTDTGAGGDFYGVMNSATFYWHIDSPVMYIWSEMTGFVTIDVINPIVTNHNGFSGPSFSFPTGFGVQLNKSIANPMDYES